LLAVAFASSFGLSASPSPLVTPISASLSALSGRSGLLLRERLLLLFWSTTACALASRSAVSSSSFFRTASARARLLLRRFCSPTASLDGLRVSGAYVICSIVTDAISTCCPWCAAQLGSNLVLDLSLFLLQLGVRWRANTPRAALRNSGR